MDGFDLGLGILFPLFPGKAERDTIMNSVAPVWDGNETWLVLGGGGLMARISAGLLHQCMPALYTPIIADADRRWSSAASPSNSASRDHQRERNSWDIAFAGGSTVGGTGARRRVGCDRCRASMSMEPTLCRRLVGLADADSQHSHRMFARGRLCPARRQHGSISRRSGTLQERSQERLAGFAAIGARSC